MSNHESKIEILDCTFRDGGYYTNWEFSDEVIKSLVRALSKTGITTVELGYKSPSKGAPLKNCSENYISNLDLEIGNLDLAFMIDLKEFVNDDLSLNKSILLQTIPDIADSSFRTCRIATHVNKLDATIEAIGCIHDLGYTVIVNIMGISLLTEEECAQAASKFHGKKIKALYFADSLGNLTPERTGQLARILLEKSSCSVGFHAHENQGLSLANTLAALEAGATFIDATVLGMGRGAGNVRLEQLLLYLNQQGRDYNPEPLVSVIDKHLLPLQKIYKWGWSYNYMLTGQKDIHPMYAQGLSQDYDLTLEQSKDILKALEFTERVPSSKYSKQVLDTAVKKSGALDLKVAVLIPARFESSRFPGKPLVDILGTPMIVRVCAIAEQAVGAGNVFVATDSQKIAEVVKEAGFSPIMTGLATTGTDRVAEAAQQIDADIIINVQGDEPLLNPQDIIDVIAQKKKCMHEVINGMCELVAGDNPDSINIPKVVAAEGGRLLYMSREPIPGWKTFTKKADRVYWKQVCIYAFTKDELEIYAAHSRGAIEKSEDIEILRFLEIGYPVKMVKTRGNTIAVDVPEDVAKVEGVLSVKSNR